MSNKKIEEIKENAKILCRRNNVSNCKCTCGYPENYKECKKLWEEI